MNTLYPLDITILKKEQLMGYNALDVIKCYGAATTNSDLATILGGMITPSVKTIFNEKACTYWVATPYDKDNIYCLTKNNFFHTNQYSRTKALRPVLTPQMTQSIMPEKMWDEKLPNGLTIKMCTCFEYPQQVAPKQISDKLTALKENNKLNKLNKIYMLDNAPVDSHYPHFAKKEYSEYELDGKRYIKVKGKPYDKDSYLSTDKTAKEDKSYWVEVLPITWLMDQSGHWLAQRNLIAGVPFGHFTLGCDPKEAIAFNFLNTYFINDIKVNQNFRQVTQKHKSNKAIITHFQTKNIRGKE